MIGALSAAAAVLLAVSGLAKLRSPAPAAAMITTLLPATRSSRSRLGPMQPLVRVGGLIELAIGVLVLAVGGRSAAALLGASYLVFTAVALRLAPRAKETSCGCFGRADSPVGAAHVVLDVVCVAVAVAAVVRPVPAGAGLFDHTPTVSAIACTQVVLLAWLGYLAITALPALASARRLEAAP